MDEKNVSQVIYNGETLIDLTEDSVTPETLAEGATAHDAAGNPITGIGKTTSVLYTEQVLEESQKEQARNNIGAASGADIAERFTPITAASTDGVSYTASVPWITELTVGARFTMLPNKLSASTSPTLDVNGLGAKYIRCLTGYNSAATVGGALAGWISANRPIDVIYDGTHWITDIQRTSVSALYGTLKVEGGGTGADNAEEALSNLGGVKKSGDTMTGALIAQNNSNHTVAQVRNVTFVPEGDDPPEIGEGDFILFFKEPDA